MCPLEHFSFSDSIYQPIVEDISNNRACFSLDCLYTQSRSELIQFIPRHAPSSLRSSSKPLQRRRLREKKSTSLQVTIMVITSIIRPRPQSPIRSIHWDEMTSLPAMIVSVAFGMLPTPSRALRHHHHYSQ